MGLDVFVVQYPKYVRIRTQERPETPSSGSDAESDKDRASGGVRKPRFGSKGRAARRAVDALEGFAKSSAKRATSRDRTHASQHHGHSSQVGADDDGDDDAGNFDMIIEAPDETPDPAKFGSGAASAGTPAPSASGALEQRSSSRAAVSASSVRASVSGQQSSTSDVAKNVHRTSGSASQRPQRDSETEVGASAGGTPVDSTVSNSAARNSARQASEAAQQAGTSDRDARSAAPDAPASGSVHSAKVDTVSDLDVDKLVRREIAWLKHDGYLAGAATYHPGSSDQFITAMFPCDDAHSAFVLTALEDLGLGSDFGSVIVLPSSSGMASYRRQGLNNPEGKAASQQQHQRRSPAGWCGLGAVLAGVCGNEADGGGGGEVRGPAAASFRLPFGPDSDSDDSEAADRRRGWQRVAGQELAAGAWTLQAMGNLSSHGSPHSSDNDGPGGALDQERSKARRDLYMKRASYVRINQLEETVRNDASLDFDYIAFLVIACVLAAIGLGMDQDPVIVASMLVSPIMSPILAFTLGLNLRSVRLGVAGLKNLAISSVLMIVIGFVATLIGVVFVSDADAWPTASMVARAGTTTLLAGIVVSVFSGAGVALSMLSDNNASLVGVAISASLLPPAVNAGMAWGVAVSHQAIQPDYGWSTSQWVRIGWQSLALYGVNAAGVAIAAFLMFWLKEVAPTSERRVRWRDDVKLARQTRRKRERRRRGQGPHSKGHGTRHTNADPSRASLSLGAMPGAQALGDAMLGVQHVGNFIDVGKEQ